jgi:acyl carrier protein
MKCSQRIGSRGRPKAQSMNDIAKTLIATALNMDPAGIDATTGLATTPQWDSLAHFRLVLALEERLARKLDPAEIVSIVDVSAVEALVDCPSTRNAS